MDRKRLLRRLSQGAVNNVHFGDLVDLAESLGFRLARASGSHYIYSHPAIPEMLNVQDVSGEAKPYQIRQLLRLVERYNLEVREPK